MSMPEEDLVLKKKKATTNRSLESLHFEEAKMQGRTDGGCLSHTLAVAFPQR